MTEKNTQIWAKDNDGVTLKKHTKDIKNCFENLSERLGNLFDNNIKNCIIWSILLHDLGKVLPYFQIVTLGNKNYEPFDVSKDLNIYHSLASALFIDQNKLKEKIGEQDIKYVLSAIAYHHWKNSLEDDLRFGSEKFERLKKFSHKDQLVNNLTNELNELLQNDVEVIKINKDMLKGLSNGLSFSDYVIPPYQMYWLPKRIEIDEAGKKKWVFISGFLQRCDHFASFCEEDNSVSLGNIEIDQIRTTDILSNIKNKIGVQGKIWQEEKLTENNKGNLILVAPTGCGKTEFAFLWSQGEKFFYTLPLRSAVEQIYERAQKIFGEDKTALLHSDVDVYLLNKKGGIESTKVYEVAKQLSYPVIISTGDQFFPYGLRPPGYERIYATFAYSRLVIDEVQAYDPKAAAIIVKFVEDITRLGGKFLLMTATLPEYVEDEIKKRISDNGNQNFTEINVYKKNNEYGSLKKHKINFIKIKNTRKDNKISFTLPDDRINEIIAKAQNQRVLVILNTVKQAEDIYNKIIDKIDKSKNMGSNQIKEKNIILFHSRFTLNKKNQIKQKLEDKFKNPKDKNDNEGKILVATQVVEAALDIDADVLYTEICPMDALIQRMGRVLRRHKEDFSLDNNAEPNVYVFVFENGYESGNGKVYDKELIEKTLIIFKEGLNTQLQWANYYDNFKEKKEKLKKIEIIPNSTTLISEYQKYEIVSALYANLNPYGEYLSDFYETLSILDAGFMSDRREEAQRIFREILDVSAIEKSKSNEVIEKVKDFIKKNEINYTFFKKEIVAEFVIQIPYYDFEGRRIFSLADFLKNNESEIRNNATNFIETKFARLLRWAEDIYIIDDEKNSEDRLDENII